MKIQAKRIKLDPSKQSHIKELADMHFIEKSLADFLVNTAKTEVNSLNNTRNNSSEAVKRKELGRELQTDYIPIVQKMRINNHMGRYGIKTNTPEIAEQKAIVVPNKPKASPDRRSQSGSYKGSKETLQALNSQADLPVLNIIPQVIHANKYIAMSRDRICIPMIKLQISNDDP